MVVRDILIQVQMHLHHILTVPVLVLMEEELLMPEILDRLEYVLFVYLGFELEGRVKI